MKDAELVLRFFAYKDLAPDYNESYTEYLNEYMEDHRQISAPLSEELLNLFNKTVNLVYDILGPRVAFRKPRNRTSPLENRWTHTSINGAIFESQMIVYSCLPPLNELSEEQIEQIRTATYNVFVDNDYWGSISQGTATRTRVTRRTQTLHSLVAKVINLAPLQFRL